jgi:hypothetical protein
MLRGFARRHWVSQRQTGIKRGERKNSFELAARRAIEPLEDRLLLAVINSLVDPLTSPGVDTSKWAITTRGLENNAPAGYNDPF